MKGRGCYWIKTVPYFTIPPDPGPIKILGEDQLHQCSLDKKMCIKECSFYRREDVTFVEFKGENYWSFNSDIKLDEFIEQHYKGV
jgi:hypothetical protein